MRPRNATLVKKQKKNIKIVIKVGELRHLKILSDYLQKKISQMARKDEFQIVRKRKQT